MTRGEIINIIRAHGLYCIPLASVGIGLTDVDGNVYDIVTVSDAGLIIDEHTTMSLRDWLGY